MIRLLSPKRDRNKGQTLVEFAMVLVVLLLMIFVIIEGGRMLMGWITVQNAARAGGRYAITGHYEPDCLSMIPPCLDPRVFSVKEEARNASTGLAINPKAKFGQPQYHQVEVYGVNEQNAWQADYAGTAGKPVLVRVMYHVPIITPLLRPFGDSVRVMGQVVMNNENFDQFKNSRADNTPPNLPPPPTPGPPAADLQVEKSSLPPVVLVNKPIKYSIRVTNHGPNDARGIIVVDTLPPGVTFVSTAPPDICTQASGVVTCSPPDLPRGGYYDITINIVAPSDAPPLPGEIINQVTVSGSEDDPDSANNTATARTLVVLSDTLVDMEVVSKDDLPDPVIVDQQLTWTIVVRNNGVNRATAVTLIDDLPSGISFLSATASKGSCDFSSGTVFCTIGNLAVGNTATVTINVKAPSSPGTIKNTASVTANEVDPDPGNNTYTEKTTISPEWSDLFLTKTDSPDPAPVGENLFYTLQVGNNGPADATNVTVTDNLPESANYVSATPSQGSCSRTGNTVTCNLGTIQSFKSANVNIVVKPKQTGVITNAATVSGDQDDPNSVNDTGTAVTTITPKADMSITKSATPASPPGVTAGNILTYKITATNNGPSPATSIKVVDALPVDVSFVNATPSKGNCSRSDPTITCSVGNLAVGSSVDITIKVIPEQEGVIVNSASVTSNQFDPDPINNTARDRTTVNPAINAFITLEPVCGDPGDEIVVNGFNWPSNGNKDVSIYWNSESASNLLGTVAKNGTVWSLKVNVPGSAPDGTHKIIAIRQNVTAEATLTVPCPAPNLTITKPRLVSPKNVKVGDPIVFEADISNIGDQDAVSQFFVGLYFDPPQPPDGSTTHLPQKYRAELVAISGLAIGASQTISITAENGFSSPGSHVVYAVVDSDPGPFGIIDERKETDNVSPPLQVDVAIGPTPTPTPIVPGPTPTPTATPGTPGSLIGQAFLIASGGDPIPQAGVEVRVYDGFAALGGITYSDIEGSYFFSDLNPDTYTISACIIIDSKSYSYTVAGVVVKPSQVTIEDLFLEPGPCS